MKTIKQFIAEHLVNTEIFEMAQSLAEYKKDIEANIYNIVVYILLIMKSNEEQVNEFINHWKREIRIYINELCEKKLKTQDNYSSRYKHVYDVIVNKLDFNDNDNIMYKFYNKLYKEGYDLDDKLVYNDFMKLFHEFQDNYLDELIDVIASKDFHKIKLFTDKL